MIGSESVLLDRFLHHEIGETVTELVGQMRKLLLSTLLAQAIEGAKSAKPKAVTEALHGARFEGGWANAMPGGAVQFDQSGLMGLGAATIVLAPPTMACRRVNAPGSFLFCIPTGPPLSAAVCAMPYQNPSAMREPELSKNKECYYSGGDRGIDWLQEIGSATGRGLGIE